MLRPTYLYATLILCCSTSLIFGQQGIPDRVGENINRGPSKSAIKSRAVKSANREDYNAAMHYYNLILQNDSLNAEAWEGYGEAAFAYPKYESAARAFETLIQHRLASDPEYIQVRLADTYYCQGNIARADSLYNLVLATPDASARAKDGARKGLERLKHRNSVLAGSWGDQVYRFPKPVNYLGYAEYAPRLADNDLYFTSYRFPMRGDSSKLLMGIMSGQYEGDSLILRSSEWNVENKHTAYATFNPDKTAVYYAVGNYTKDTRIRFELYRRRRPVADAPWGEPERLPQIINMPGTTTTQPHIARLKGEKGETLFFVSNRTDGKGKKDIWYCKVEQDSFSAPQNFYLNTDADDITPFYDVVNDKFYFSSKGYKGSFGGLDIYQAVFPGSPDAPTVPVHLPEPVNSGANDIFFSTIGDKDAGCDLSFFASNRYGAYNESEEDCCYDLYATRINNTIKIDLFLAEKGSDQLLPPVGVTMRLMEKDGMGGYAEVDKKVLEDPADNTFSGILPDKSYAVISMKRGYYSDTLYFETRGRFWVECLYERRILRPKVELVVCVYDCDSKEPLVSGLTAQFSDMSYLNPDHGGVETGPAGGALSQEQNMYEGDNCFKKSLDFDHNYKILVSKPGYTSDSTTVSTTGFFVDTTLRVDLCLKRGLMFCSHVFDDITKNPLDSIVFTLYDITDEDRMLLAGKHLTWKDDNFYPDTLIHYDRRYRIVANKANYSTDSLDFQTFDRDKKPFDKICLDLFLKPLIVEKYLPIVLYFDNDEPDKRTLSTTTEKLYVQTYTQYYARKKVYVDTCCTGLADAAAKRFEMDTFFDNQIQREWLKLFYFQEVLIDILRSGKHVEITLKGYASPRGHGPYNKNLTSRRVKSVRNQLSNFEGENYFTPYIKSGQLKLSEEPYGSSKADKAVPGGSKDPRSIYSVGAAKERRVEIIGISVEDTPKLQEVLQK